MNKKQKKKAIVLSLGLTVAMLSAPPVQAQGIFGGLCDDHYSRQGQQSKQGGGLMGRGNSSVGGDLTGQGFGATNGDITGQTFGDDAPLGSGLFVLFAAGAGYASIKSRKKQNKQNRKEK